MKEAFNNITKQVIDNDGGLKMKAIKIDVGYVYKIYGGNIRYTTDIYYLKDSTIKRYIKRLKSMGIEYVINDNDGVKEVKEWHEE